MSVEKYRHTFWRPDRDYVDGAATERNLGLMPHGIVVSNLCGLLQKVPGYHGLVSVRAEIRPDRYRCIDFCLLADTAIHEDVIRTAPLVAVEVLQQETIEQMTGRIADYLEMGCEFIWVIDPFRLQVWSLENGSMQRASTLSVLDRTLSLEEIFEDLPPSDELE